MSEGFILNRYEITDVHEISVNYDGLNYLVVYGKHINGGFFCIPNWNCSGELASYSDVLWNTESININLKSIKAARAIAECIAGSSLL